MTETITPYLVRRQGLIESRVPREEYDATEGVSITRLKYLQHSPMHYQYFLQNPKKSDALTLGIATHVATLEPERFTRDFAVWSRTTEAGSSAPRKGQYWDAFCLENEGKTILTREEARIANTIAAAVRFDPVANQYLASGEPEVSLQWQIGERQCKGRVDWLTTPAAPVIVGLKTARDCRHFQFGAQAARLGYHLQWAYYHDGYEAITGKRARMVEIVVDTEAPHAVAVYNIPNDILEQGREEYTRLLELLSWCETNNEWPGPNLSEQDLTLPTWAYQREDEDMSDLGLEAIA